MTFIIVLDSDEEHALKATADNGLVQRYKEHTLPVLGYYDDFRKLDLVRHTSRYTSFRSKSSL